MITKPAQNCHHRKQPRQIVSWLSISWASSKNGPGQKGSNSSGIMLLLIQEISSTRTPEQLEELKRRIAELIDKIEADREFEPRESALCDWCGYWSYCPLKKQRCQTPETGS